MAEAWKKIREAIQTGDPHPLSHFLGCTHEAVRVIPPGGTEEVTGQVKNMEGSFRKRVETFQHLAGDDVKMKTVPTPFIRESPGPADAP